MYLDESLTCGAPRILVCIFCCFASPNRYNWMLGIVSPLPYLVYSFLLS